MICSLRGGQGSASTSVMPPSPRPRRPRRPRRCLRFLHAGCRWYACHGGNVVCGTSLEHLAASSSYRVKEFSQRLGLDPRSVYRIFQRDLGLPPKDWLRGQRMVTARLLLRLNLPIKQISEKLGFLHPKDFSREFFHCYQTSPSAFRSTEQRRLLTWLHQHGCGSDPFSDPAAMSDFGCETYLENAG